MSIISLKKLIFTSLLSQRLVCIINYPKTLSIRLPCVLHARAEYFGIFINIKRFSSEKDVSYK